MNQPQQATKSDKRLSESQIGVMVALWCLGFGLTLRFAPQNLLTYGMLVSSGILASRAGLKTWHQRKKRISDSDR